MIKIVGNRIIATEDEPRACPKNPKWATTMLKLFGPKLASESKLKVFLTCPEVVEAAGYELKVLKTPEEAEELIRKLEQVQE